MVTEIELFESANTKAFSIKKAKLLPINFILIPFCLNDKFERRNGKFLTVQYKYSELPYGQPQCTLQLVCEDRVLSV
jgi:hypothetical protein